MENLTTNLHTEKNRVYGRSFKNDMELFYNDLSIRNVLAVFGRFELVQSARHLSDIKSISLEEATDKLECLENLGLIQRETGGYMLTSNKLYDQTMPESLELRKDQHAKRLLQIAGKYKDSDDFSDLHGVLCTSETEARLLKSKIRDVIREFAEQNQKIHSKDKNTILNIGLALTCENLKDPKGGN